MFETIDELLNHITGKRLIKNFCIRNITEDTISFYEFDEIINIGHYKVVGWEFDLYGNQLNIAIEE